MNAMNGCYHNCLPDWALEVAFLPGVVGGFPDWLSELILPSLDRDAAGIDHNYTYRDKVAIADGYHANNEIGKLFAILTGNGIEFVLSGHSPYHPGAFQIIMWQPADEAIAVRLLELQYNPLVFEALIKGSR